MKLANKRGVFGWLLIINLILFLPLVIGADSVWTGAISPVSADVCGQYTNTITITASHIFNKEKIELGNVTARLSGDLSGFIFMSDQQVNLGNITASGESNINPTWTIRCNPGFEGTYQLFIEYSADGGFTGSSQNNAVSAITIHSNYDVTPPVIIEHLPRNTITTRYVTLSATTNENAVCRYSKIANVNYDNMVTSFGITGNLIHEAYLTGLTDGVQNYYVKCKDNNNNVNVQDYVISFNLNSPPTATITLNKVSPVSSGQLEVTLVTSKNVLPIPSLKYSYDSITWNNIPLEGSGTIWKGNAIIKTEDDSKIAEFKFLANDLTGNEGSIIVSGNSFLVDTRAPLPPREVKIEQKDGGILLSWKSIENDIKNYKIYKSEVPEIDNTDYYNSVETNSFKDENISSDKTYYYAISAVDKAGNEGELTPVIKLVEETPATVVSEVPVVEETAIKSIDNQNIQQMISDIDRMISNADEVSQDGTVDLFGFQKTVKDGKNELINLKKELNDISARGIWVPRIDEISQRINDLTGIIPQKIILNYEKTVQVTSAKDVIELITKQLSKKEDTRYISKIVKFQKNLDVDAYVKQYTITYSSGIEKDVTLVRKEINMDNWDELSSFDIIEVIPKEVVENVDQISFKGEMSVINPDPIVRFSLLPQEKIVLEYIINKAVNSDDLVNIKSVGFVDLDSFIKGEDISSNQVTGFAVIQGLFNGISVNGVIIILGMIIIVGLCGYYFVYLKEPAEVRRSLRKQEAKVIPAKKEVVLQEKMAYPNYASQEYTSKGLVNLKDINICLQISQANNAINQMKFDNATKSYYLMLSSLESAEQNLNDEEKQEYKQKIDRLYQKMTLCLKIKQAYTCIQNKDHANLRHILNQMAKLYNNLLNEVDNDEINLLDTAKYYHSKYSSELINSGFGSK